MPDRRVGRTRQALQDALIDLILEKGYEKISVQEICARANIGRTTFYAHFLDKADLLEKSFAEFIDVLHFTIAHNQEPRQLMPLTTIFQHIAERADLAKAYLRQPPLLRSVQQQLSTFTVLRLEEVCPNLDQEQRQLRAEFLVGGLIAIVRWWVEAEMPISADAAAVSAATLIEPLQQQESPAIPQTW